LLYGVHHVVLHPVMLLLAWRRLFGWRRVECKATGVRTGLFDPRLWLVALVHDFGYFGCAEMDGPTGKWHPALGARLVSAVLNENVADRSRPSLEQYHEAFWRDGWSDERARRLALRLVDLGPWGRFTLFHSRSVCRRLDHRPSLLAAADKLAGLPMYPRRLYLALARATGELDEYMTVAASQEGGSVGIDSTSPSRWFDSLAAYMERVAWSIAAGEDAEPPPPETDDRNDRLRVILAEAIGEDGSVVWDYRFLIGEDGDVAFDDVMAEMDRFARAIRSRAKAEGVRIARLRFSLKRR
jgi:hypothetical protein